MPSLFYRAPNKIYPRAEIGDGLYLITADGKRVLDGSCGAAVSCVGHGNEFVIDAICKQAQSLAFAHSSFFTNNPAEDLSSLLIERSGSSFSRAIFLCSGSEAIESTFKLARQYHLCNDDLGRVNIIGREYSYHGNTLGALAAGWNPPRRRPFEPLLSPAFHHVPRCFFLEDADSQKGEDLPAYVARLLAAYERKFEQLGPQTVAAVIVEPVVGATLGTVPAPPEYLAGLRELCDRHGALLIYDEVMCGMGRCGTMHAWQSLGGVPPDLQAIGKGLAAGYQPLSAVLLGSKVYDKIAAHTEKPFLSSQTYQDHAIGCAAGIAVQTLINEHSLLKNVNLRGQQLCEELWVKLPKTTIKDVRGLGLFQTVQLQAGVDKVTGKALAADVCRVSFEMGATAYLCSTAVDAVLFAPPFIITAEQITELVEIFTAALKAVLKERNVLVNGNS